MKINKQTLLFEDLNAEEANELYTIAEKIILKGEIPSKDNPLITQWLTGTNDNTWLLTMSTVFPARALLSVLRFHNFTTVTPIFGSFPDLIP